MISGGGGEEFPPPTRPEPPTPQGPEAAPWRVQPLPVPAEDDRMWLAEDDRMWLQEWLDLVARSTGKEGSGC
jgi:ABC-type Fe3+ transport system substrate-binding protein